MYIGRCAYIVHNKLALGIHLGGFCIHSGFPFLYCPTRITVFLATLGCVPTENFRAFALFTLFIFFPAVALPA